MTRRPPHRHRRRQPLRAGRRHAGRQPLPAPARPAGEPARLLAQPPVAELPVLGHVHRPDQPGAARRRGAQRPGLRARDRARARSSAAAQIYGADMPPWLVDRTLRNILVDVTGNTHRSEFCIDKLYSPDGATGRLGLLELRAFEMPPHARMSLAQQLLLRALVARFWDEPYQRARHALGHRAARPLPAADLRPDGLRRRASPRCAQAGFAFDAGLVRAALRVPLPAGRRGRSAMGIELTLRNALEPWHVMGEEGAAGGTVRYVDSSLERHRGARHRPERQPPRRHRQRPARCRCSPPAASASSSPACATGLAAAVGAAPDASASHAPLTFDIVDTWMKRSLGGCQYHVAHPGGRNYDTFPVNAYEAESRRLARFFAHGPHAGPDAGAAGDHRSAGQPGIPVHAGPATLTCSRVTAV